MHQGKKKLASRRARRRTHLQEGSDLSNIALVISSDEKHQIYLNQAIGMVSAAQANFIRIIVQSDCLQTTTIELVPSEPSKSANEGSSKREKLVSPVVTGLTLIK
ncbi:thiamine phosphate phosphatase [Sarracenia purpurea var. burkii]